mmetsp:Transcript_110433/g.276441  ORF Transcript_110433/g.276441 Transcript_110433/m.276441 type:complete len:413 (+) Transcript_110433:124-1362(+)
MTEEVCPNAGRELPAPLGLPAGWKCIEKRYLSGPNAGKSYTRFNGPDLKHKSVLSVRAAIRLDAQDRGLNVDEEVAKYDVLKQEKAEMIAKARQEASTLSNTKNEEAVQRFRSKFGMLDSSTARALPGWSCDVSHVASRQLYRVTYVDPEGIRYASVQDVERCLGLRMGDALDDVIALVETAKAKSNPMLETKFKFEARQSSYAQGTMALADAFSKSTAMAKSPGGGGLLACKTFEEGKSVQLGLPSTPPKRSAGSSGCTDGGEPADKIATPSPVASSAAGRKPGARGHDATAEDASACEVPKGCPWCSTQLEWTAFSEGNYAEAGGWQCDYFETCGLNSDETGSWWRWLCRKCESDWCEHCFKELPCHGAKTTGKRPLPSGSTPSTQSRKKATEGYAGLKAFFPVAAGVRS